MKKKDAQSADASSDYRVGEVSASLLQKNRAAAASGSLAALFGGAAKAAGVLFRAAPQLPQLSEQPEAPEVKGEAGRKPKRKKIPKVKTEAEQKLENRELGLQNADEAERAAPAERRKRGPPEAGPETEAERSVLKRQRRRREKLEEQSKNRRTVFVGNLPVSCDKKTLLSMFRADGAVESIRFRSLVREDPAVSRRVAAIKRQAHPSAQSINAYVVFKEPQGAAKALQRNGAEIEKDFIIRVDRVSSEAAESHDHKRSIFVGNLNFELKELALRRHFEQCGVVEAVRLVRDTKTGLGKGFGYVLFEVSAAATASDAPGESPAVSSPPSKSRDSVQLALKLDGSEVEGRAIRVRRSVGKEARRAPQPRRRRLDDAYKGEMAHPHQKAEKKTGKKKARKNIRRT